MIDTINNFIANPEQRIKLITQIKLQSDKFNWDQTGLQLFNHLLKI